MRRPEGAIEDFKKVPRPLAKIAREKGVDPAAIEIWFADEARVGQKNKITRRWAGAARGRRRRTISGPPRPTSSVRSAPPRARRRRSSCPAATSTAMDLHLAEIATRSRRRACRPAARSGRMAPVGPARRPANITLMPLPPKCPELNPVENIWQFMRDNWLSNRVFKSYDDIVDHCCDAWNKLVDQPWRIMSIGLRDWATGSDQGDLVLERRAPTFCRCGALSGLLRPYRVRSFGRSSGARHVDHQARFSSCHRPGGSIARRPANAQQPAPQPQPPRISLTSLTAQGFKIKAVSSAPSNFQVLFIQKGKDAYACIRRTAWRR